MRAGERHTHRHTHRKRGRERGERGEVIHTQREREGGKGRGSADVCFLPCFCENEPFSLRRKMTWLGSSCQAGQMDNAQILSWESQQCRARQSKEGWKLLEHLHGLAMRMLMSLVRKRSQGRIKSVKKHCMDESGDA